MNTLIQREREGTAMAKPHLITTDLNARERERYAKGLEGLAAEAVKAAMALRTEQDSEALIALITLSFSDGAVRELMKVFADAIPAPVKAPDDASTISENATTK
jgi:hypothetical protein